MRVRLFVPLPGPFVLTSGGGSRHQSRKIARNTKRTARSAAATATAIDEQNRMIRQAQRAAEYAQMQPAEEAYARIKDNPLRNASIFLGILIFVLFCVSFGVPYLWPVVALLSWWLGARARDRHHEIMRLADEAAIEAGTETPTAKRGRERAEKEQRVAVAHERGKAERADIRQRTADRRARRRK